MWSVSKVGVSVVAALGVMGLALVPASAFAAAPAASGDLPPVPSVDGCTFYRGVTTCQWQSTSQTVENVYETHQETVLGDAVTSTTSATTWGTPTVQVNSANACSAAGYPDGYRKYKADSTVTVTTSTTQAWQQYDVTTMKTVTTDWLTTINLSHQGAPASDGKVLSSSANTVQTGQSETQPVEVSRVLTDSGVNVLSSTVDSVTTTSTGFGNICYASAEDFLASVQ